MNKSVYQKQRARSDEYIPAMNKMAGEIMVLNNLLPIYFVNPTVAEDQREGIDMHVITDKVTLAYRTRSSRYKNFYLEAFTLRNPTELKKVIEGAYADYLLYAVTHPKNPGELESGILINMKQVGWMLKEYHHLLRDASKHEDLIEFKYVDFPFNVVAGLSGITTSDLKEWDETRDFVRRMTTGNSYSEHVQ